MTPLLLGAVLLGLRFLNGPMLEQESRFIWRRVTPQIMAQVAMFQWTPPTTFALTDIAVDGSPEPLLPVWRWRWTTWILRQVGLERPAQDPRFIVEVFAHGKMIAMWPTDMVTTISLPSPILLRAGDLLQIRVTNAYRDDSLWRASVDLGGRSFSPRKDTP